MPTPIARLGFTHNRPVASLRFSKKDKPLATLGFKEHSTDGSMKIDGKKFYVYLVTDFGSSCKYNPATSSQMHEIKQRLLESWEKHKNENKDAPELRDLRRIEFKWHFLDDLSTIDYHENPSISIMRAGKPLEYVSLASSSRNFSKIRHVAKYHLCDGFRNIMASKDFKSPLHSIKV